VTVMLAGVTMTSVARSSSSVNTRSGASREPSFPFFRANLSCPLRPRLQYASPSGGFTTTTVVKAAFEAGRPLGFHILAFHGPSSLRLGHTKRIFTAPCATCNNARTTHTAGKANP
jgi:hypothetical protein